MTRAKRAVRPPRNPRSACPRCYRDNEPVAEWPDTPLLLFQCDCGEHWVSATKEATAHAKWLTHAHYQQNVGDK